MAQSEGLMWIDGEFVPAGEAKISILDAGFWLGINVFDTIAARQGFIFKLEAHLERFYQSLHAVRFSLPYTRDELGHLVVETVRRSGLRDAYINCIATRGLRAPSRIDEWKPTTIIWAIPYVSILGEDIIQRGAKARIASVRNLPVECLDPKIKTFNRLHFYMARLEALDAGADTPILLDLDGRVSENPGANVFVVKDGRLHTPTEDILMGVTRETVLEIAQRESVPAGSMRLGPYDLYNADEVFLSSTLGGIIPVVEVDNRQVGDGQPGAITRRFQEIYWGMHVEGDYATPIYTARPPDRRCHLMCPEAVPDDARRATLHRLSGDKGHRYRDGRWSHRSLRRGGGPLRRHLHGRYRHRRSGRDSGGFDFYGSGWLPGG